MNSFEKEQKTKDDYVLSGFIFTTLKLCEKLSKTSFTLTEKRCLASPISFKQELFLHLNRAWQTLIKHQNEA